MRLTTRIHDRDVAGLTYVYPVVSRRARGVSVGINLNPNQACNFRCVYCQVPGLVFGSAPEIDLALLERELTGMLDAMVRGDYMERHVPEGSRVLKDVAISGNGEPTSSRQFDQVVELVRRSMAAFHLEIPLVLITNGSLVQRPEVQRGIAALGRERGAVWFKLDSATEEGMARINDYHGGVERIRKNLATAASLAPTWLQTCVFARNGEPPSETEQLAYLDFVRSARADGVELAGVLLYGLARPSHQPEAPELSALDAAWLEAFAERIRATGLTVEVSP